MPMSFDEKATRWDTDPKKIERAETVAAAIRRQVPLSPSTRTLEYGCGTGLLGFALQPAVGELVLADSSPGMLSVVEQKIAAGGFDQVRMLHLDLSAEPTPDEYFDLICSLMTLHHVDDYQGLLAAFWELLNSGGYLCVADLDVEDGSFHGSDFSGHQGFDRQKLAGVLTRIGFVDVNFTTVFEVVRGEEGALKGYPVFLMVCRRP
jgi:ubiquinone/menaquinone biosynthesis C-methylase UbiE